MYAIYITTRSGYGDDSELFRTYYEAREAAEEVIKKYGCGTIRDEIYSKEYIYNDETYPLIEIRREAIEDNVGFSLSRTIRDALETIEDVFKATYKFQPGEKETLLEIKELLETAEKKTNNLGE